ncbi:MAG TPA: DUF6502 family protein [bacterium]|nr:DUF6502 family protein [bacterium]
MTTNSQSILQAAVVRLLKPLVRLLLRHGVSLGAFMDLAKRVYVELALHEFGIPGRKPSISRAAIITGMTRKEVTRIAGLPLVSDAAVQDTYNRAVRVIGGWVRDPAFLDADGQPASLPLEGATGSFTALVRRYSGDVPVRAMRDELLRVGALEQAPDGRLHLASEAYVPAHADADKIGILGADVADLIATIDHNLTHTPERSRLQLKVAYDNLPREPLETFRGAAAGEAFKLLQRFDRQLSALDRDANPVVEGTGRMRAGIGIYYFEEACDTDSQD